MQAAGRTMMTDWSAEGRMTWQQGDEPQRRPGAWEVGRQRSPQEQRERGKGTTGGWEGLRGEGVDVGGA